MAGKAIASLAMSVSGQVVGDPTVVVDDVTHDSRSVRPGSLYVAVRGATHDGHDFVDSAIDSGAAALCLMHQIDSDVAQIVVDDTRRAMGPLAAAVHDHPSRSLAVVGVTGTNGKTTVTHYVDAICAGAGMASGLIGTIRTGLGDETFESVLTTPEATDFQRLLGRMRDRGAVVVSVEVSSHALELQRVRSTSFAVAAFTNLTQDHLDFHGDMAAYRHAKERLFREYEVGTAVFNTDDAMGRDLALSHSGPKLTVGESGDVEASEIVHTTNGTEFTLTLNGVSRRVRTPVRGYFNVTNAAIASAICLALDVSEADLVDGLEDLPGVPGRFEVVSLPGTPLVVVDYAHTPDSVATAIDAARREVAGKVIVVLGAGGDRDASKRPLMGRAASAADMVIVTNDNPRSEQPREIADAVRAGVDESTSAVIQLDREQAIGDALGHARPGDAVLVLGKGHEPGQQVGGNTQPFDDREVAKRLLVESAGKDRPSGSMSP